RRVPAALASLLALVVLLIELWPVSGSVMSPVIGPRVPHVLDQGRDDVVQFLEKAGPAGTFRVWPIEDIQSNRLAGFGVASIGGYHAAKPRLYQDLVDARLLPSPGAPTTFSMPWIRLLNIRYIVSPQPLDVPWLHAGCQGSAIVLENPTALPRATLLTEYKVAPNPTAILDSLDSPRNDSGRWTWLESDPHLTLGGAGAVSMRAEITRYRLNDVS